MDISWLGNSSVVIKGKNAAIGLNAKKTENLDLLVFSETQDKIKLNEGQFLIDGPGEFEIKSVTVYSVLDQEGKSSGTFQLIVDEISIYYTNNLDFTPNKEQISDMGTIDLAFIPISPAKEDEKKVQELLEKLEPRIIIPIAKSDETSAQVCLDLSRKLGFKCEEPVKVFKLKGRAVLPEEDQLFVVLEKSK